MPQINIQAGDNLSTLAATHGTSVQAIMAANPNLTDPNKIMAGAKLMIPDATGAAPTGGAGGSAMGGTNVDNPIGGNTQSPGGMITSLSTALRTALDEAAASKRAGRIKALSTGFMPEGSSPSVIQAAISLANNGVQSGADKMYSDTINAVTEARRSSLDLLKTFANDGSLADMPDTSLMAMSKAAGLDEGTALAWKAKIAAANKMDDQKKALEMKRLNLEIQVAQKNLTAGPKANDAVLGQLEINRINEENPGLNLTYGTTKNQAGKMVDDFNALSSLKESGKSRQEVETQYQEDNGSEVPDNVAAMLDSIYAAPKKHWWNTAIDTIFNQGKVGDSGFNQ